MKEYEVEVVQRVHLRIRLLARDRAAALWGARAYASHKSGVAVRVESVDVLVQHVEAHPCAPTRRVAT